MDDNPFQPLADLAALIDRRDIRLREDCFVVGGHAVIDYLNGFDDVPHRTTTEDIDLVLVGDRREEWRSILQEAGWKQDDRHRFRFHDPEGSQKVDLLALQTEQSQRPGASTHPPDPGEEEYYVVLARVIWHEGQSEHHWPAHLLEPMNDPQSRRDGWMRLNIVGLFLTKLAALRCCIDWLQGARRDELIESAIGRIPRDAQDLGNLLRSLRSTPQLLPRAIDSLNRTGRERVVANVRALDCFVRYANGDFPDQEQVIGGIVELLRAARMDGIRPP